MEVHPGMYLIQQVFLCEVMQLVQYSVYGWTTIAVEHDLCLKHIYPAVLVIRNMDHFQKWFVSVLHTCAAHMCERSKVQSMCCSGSCTC